MLCNAQIVIGAGFFRPRQHSKMAVRYYKLVHPVRNSSLRRSHRREPRQVVLKRLNHGAESRHLVFRCLIGFYPTLNSAPVAINESRHALYSVSVRQLPVWTAPRLLLDKIAVRSVADLADAEPRQHRFRAHKPAFGRKAAGGAHGSGSIGHATFEMRDAAHHIHARIQSADHPSLASGRAQPAILRKGHQLQVDLALDDVAHFQQRADLGCVIVKGAGGHFCAGGDIAEYPGFRFDEAALQRFHEDEVWGALSAMLACDVPLVAQIEGVCMGAGVEIASTCDLRLAADSASFGAPIARLGFPMAAREAALVSGAVGEMTARAMLLAAQVFPAAQMAQQGFLTQVLPAGSLADAALTLAHQVAALAPQAARLNKQTLRALQQGQTLARPYAYADSAEHREGIRAFLEKRQPEF